MDSVAPDGGDGRGTWAVGEVGAVRAVDDFEAPSDRGAFLGDAGRVRRVAPDVACQPFLPSDARHFSECLWEQKMPFWPESLVPGTGKIPA